MKKIFIFVSLRRLLILNENESWLAIDGMFSSPYGDYLF